MINIHTDRDDFDLGIEDFGISEGSDINLYVLDENMKALSLMEAQRAIFPGMPWSLSPEVP